VVVVVVAVWWVRAERQWQVCDVDARQGWKRSGLDWLARGASPRKTGIDRGVLLNLGQRAGGKEERAV
jgi:hypothetical protein